MGVTDWFSLTTLQLDISHTLSDPLLGQIEFYIIKPRIYCGLSGGLLNCDDLFRCHTMVNGAKF